MGIREGSEGDGWRYELPESEREPEGERNPGINGR
jgi:hypothetical protein